MRILAKIVSPILRCRRRIRKMQSDRQIDREQYLFRKQFVNRGNRINNSIEFTGEFKPEYIKEVGIRCELQKNLVFWFDPADDAPSELSMGNRVFLGLGTYLGVSAPVTIGSNTIVGAYSYIISANHEYGRRDLPVRDQGFSRAPVIIGDDVWLGTHVVVLPGVTIGTGAIVGAGSVVTKSIPEYEIWGGVPARKIKDRPE